MKPKTSELNWKGLNWKKEKYRNLFLLSLPNQEEDYYRLAKEYADFFSNLILKINKLKIFTVKPIIYFALFPTEIFLEKTQVPFSWATGCVRSIKDGGVSDTLCYKYIPNQKVTSFEKLSPDFKRGELHEILHLFFGQQINKSGSIKFIRSINEGFCEFIPRIIFNLQKDMIKSTKYLASLTEKDLVSFQNLDKYGMAHFSPEKIDKNRAYASAFLGVMWLVKKLSGAEGDYFSGTKNMLNLLAKCSDRKQIYAEIKLKTKIDMLNSKLPILESINDLKNSNDPSRIFK